MKKYQVVWEVSKFALVEANSEEEAIEKVHNGEVEEQEKEITMPLEAYEMDWR
jgi:alpha-D-ribose 1-methylphosphonate 5-triphosphate synthase subunit PhnH